MIIECPYCESKVDGVVKGEHESYDPHEDPFPFKAVLIQCPVCNNALLGGTELIQVELNRSRGNS
jgi:sarcosine oxidase delta subunit